jgi:hypothetical protein
MHSRRQEGAIQAIRLRANPCFKKVDSDPIFPKAFSAGPLHNVSFEVGGDANAENNFLSPSKRAFVAGLQFAFDLPYKGFFNVAPI